MPCSTRLAAVLFLAAAPVFGRLTVDLCGTHPGRGAEEIALHRRAAPLRLAKRAALAAAGIRPASRDIGNLAILDDADGFVTRRNLFNLEARSIEFSRLNDTGRYQFQTSAGGYSSELAASGEALTGLGDDDARAIALPFPFPYYGRTYTRLYLNSDGNFTFDEPEAASSSRTLGRMTAGPPRIAGFFEDLDPSVGGELRLTSSATVFALSWVRVPEYSPSGFGPRNTFQIALFPDGRIRFAYESLNTRSAVVGITPGALTGGTTLVAFSTMPTGAAGGYAGTVAERFTSTEEVDVVYAAQQFYKTHDDVYDFLVFYNTMGVVAAPGAVAYESTVRSRRAGIGVPVTDNGAVYGSPRRLQAILNLGPLNQYPRDPNAIVPARGTAGDTPLTVLGHEAGHLWLAYVSVRAPGNPNARPMLGFQGAHWGFGTNSEASLMEGNRIQDNGPEALPRFRTIAAVEGFAPLDQYLMGLRPPDEVPPTFYVVPSGPLPQGPQRGVNFNGERRDVAIEDIVAAEGRRTPDHTVTQRRFRFAFVVITAAGTEPDEAALAQIEGYRVAFEPFFERVTGGRAFAETSLQRATQLSLSPAGGVVAGRAVTASITAQRAPGADLPIAVRTSNEVATAPGEVVLRAGQTRVTFEVRGLREGVEELSAVPADAAYASAWARIPVSPAAALRLAALSGDVQTVAAGGRGAPLPRPLVIAAVDANNVPYAEQSIAVTVTSGSVVPSQAVTGEDGTASFMWTPGAGPVYELRASLQGNGAASTLIMSAVGKPFVTAGGAVNSASFVSGLPRGGLATIFGASLAGGATAAAASLPLPLRMGGVSVTIDGQPASLVYVSDRQINLVVPQTAVAAASVNVTVTWGAESVSFNAPVKASDPGVFVIDGNRTAAALIAGTGLTTLARPAAAGDALEIYCTGLDADRPSVTIGSREAEVLFSGPAPAFPGLQQVNVRVPAGLTAGPQTLTLRSGGVAANETGLRLR